ncbi:uncharacterized protein [Anabrus simplex]|uniref:uncharacterized protein n=1 Tax=Anabrus simplex TaxID=316456 RepID=UPI0035A26290
MQCEMDQEVKIKEEPAWLKETTNASLENIEHVSEVIALKQEAKSELTEPESTQENSLEPSEDNKKEIFIEQNTDDQLLAYVKEETQPILLMPSLNDVYELVHSYIVRSFLRVIM